MSFNKPQSQWSEADWQKECLRLCHEFGATPSPKHCLDHFGDVIDYEQSDEAVAFGEQEAKRESEWIAEAEAQAARYADLRNKKVQTGIANFGSGEDDLTAELSDWIREKERRGWWPKN